MKVNEDMILKLERLARLSLSPESRQALSKDLEDILKMVAKLEELDLQDVEPLRHLSPVKHVVRQDRREEHLPPQEALGNAPKHDDDYFIVPKVIDR